VQDLENYPIECQELDDSNHLDSVFLHIRHILFLTFLPCTFEKEDLSKEQKTIVEVAKVDSSEEVEEEQS